MHKADPEPSVQKEETKEATPVQPVQVMSICKGLQDGTIKAEEVITEERRECVDYLIKTTKNTDQELAVLLGVHRNTILNDKRWLEKRAYEEVGIIENKTYMQKIVSEAERLKERARRQGNTALEWKIQKELTDALGRMGFIKWQSEFSPDIFLGGKNETNVTNVTLQAEKITMVRTVLNAVSHKQRTTILRAWRIAKRAGTPNA